MCECVAMESSDLRFGFKQLSSCSHALYAFSESIKYFTSKCNKVYAAFLAASNAFDMNIYMLVFFVKMSLYVLCCYCVVGTDYSRLQCVVRWQNSFGGSFPVTCRVRQGGVLSPYLFAYCIVYRRFNWQSYDRVFPLQINLPLTLMED